MTPRLSCSGVLLSFACAASLSLACNEPESVRTSNMVSGIVTEATPGGDAGGEPVADVLVCQLDSFNCATTDGSGLYSMFVLKNSNLALSYTKEGYGPVLVATRSTQIDLTVNAGLATTEALVEFFDALDAEFPPQASGYLSATALRDASSLSGIGYGLVGSSGTSFYLDDEGAPDASLTETQDLGSGGFIDVAPVNVEVTASGAANCVAANSWPAAATNTARLPIRVGFWTQTTFECR